MNSETTTETLHITLLGSPGLTRNAEPVTGLAYSRAAALVYYLAATGRSHTREALSGLFWSETSDEQARKNLRDVLANLRRVLAPYLTISRQTVSLNSAAPILTDSRRFELHLETARKATDQADKVQALRAAVTLYRGDFLEGVYVAQAPAFEEWMLAERERFRQLALHARHTLVTYSAQQGHYLEGIDDATRLLTLDPLHEESHRQLIWLLALSGQRSAALAQYETLCRMLDDELGMEPTEETQALYEQIVDDTIASTAVTAPLPPTTRPLHNLPASLTHFVGRAAEIAHLLDRLASGSVRLLTLVGPGGVGKTTLALHVANQVVATGLAETAFPHGVFFVSLGALTPDSRTEQAALANDLAARIGDALGFTFAGADDLYTQIRNYLQTKQLLLVLDNFEQLLGATESIIRLLHHAPELSLMITSRTRLNVRGEQIAELAGLPIPGMQEMAVPSVWERYDALQLFRQTAEAVHPQLAWTAADKAAAARICRLVGGLPLGIELAASMVRLLPVAEIARELEQNLNILYDTRRDTPERHQSLRAVFDHSWSLLSPEERMVVRRLSVFRDGFNQVVAEYVCSDHAGVGNGDPLPTPSAMRSTGQFLALFATLVDSSLVRRVITGEHETASTRFHLLEVVRQYAAEQLTLAMDAAEEAAHAVRDRHCHYYLAFVREHAAKLRGPGQRETTETVHQELENIRHAWQWAVARGHYQALDWAAMGLFYVYEMQSWFQEGATAFAAAAECLAALQNTEPADDVQRIGGMLLAQQGWFTFHLGRQEAARALLERSLTLLRPLNREAELIFPLNRLAAITYHAGDYTRATQLVQEALGLSLALGDRDGEAVARTILGEIAYRVGDYAEARRHCQESLAVERSLGNTWGTVFNLIMLGRVAYALGEYVEARHQFQESLIIRHAIADTRGIALCLNYLGETAAAQGNYAEARGLYRESLALFREIGNLAGAALGLTRLGDTALALQEPDAARQYFREALSSARQAQALPHMLAALAGIAMVQIDTDPDLAETLVALGEQHPATTQETRDRVTTLRARLPTADTRATYTATQRQPVPQDLESVIQRLEIK